MSNGIESTSAKWTQERIDILIPLLHEQFGKGKGSDTGLKKEAWAHVVPTFNNLSKTNYSKQQLQSQYASLKKQYRIIAKIRDNSGFGWDEENQLPTAPDSVWADYLAAHPEAKPFRSRTLKNYEQLSEMFQDMIATGQFATTHVSCNSKNLVILDELDSNMESDISFPSKQIKQAVPSTNIITVITSSPIKQDPPCTPVKRENGLHSARKSLRKRVKTNQMLDAIQALVDGQVKVAKVKKETSLQQAIKTFQIDYPQLTPKEKLKFTMHITKNLREAEMYSLLDTETRKEYLENVLLLD